MKQRTAILSDLVEAAKHLAALQDCLTRASVALEGRRGPEARDALTQVEAARGEAYDERFESLVETAITLAGRMP